MKTFFAGLSVFLTALSAFAQSTFNVNLTGANQVPPNSSLNSGSGQFTLNGNQLSWSIGCPDLSFTPTGANVHGPATSSQTASSIFSLGTPTVGPGPQGGTLTLYAGSIALTAPQITELQGELWYVNILSAQFPNGEIRGQLIAVPEPSTLALFGMAGALIAVGAFKRRKGSTTMLVTVFCFVAAFSETKAQSVIDSATTSGSVTVPLGGTPTGQFVAPWVDVPPTMPYRDGLPVVEEPPYPPLPGAFGESASSVVPEPSTIALLCGGAALLALQLRRVNPS